MAKQVETKLIDDLDGNKAAETVTFGLDGKLYEIDLSKSNASKLRKALEPFIEAGRKVRSPVRGRKSARANSNGQRKASKSDAAQIREWALSQGMEVPARGRISAEVRAAYEAGHA